MRILITTTQTLAAGLLAFASVSAQLLPAESLPAQAPSAQAPPAAVVGAPKLLDCIEAPYAYVALESGHANGAGANQNAVQVLLADPSLDVIFGAASSGSASAGGGARDANDEASGAAPGGTQQALGLVRRMLERGASEMELAMTGILARQGQPLVVLRARLRHDQANALRLSLESVTSQAVPSRKLGGNQTYSFARGSELAAGEVFEMAVVGDDVVFGNDSSAMREVLEPLPEHTSTQPARRVLSADPHFRSLRKRLDVPAGSLLAYGDWQRLGRRLQTYMDGVPAQLLGSSGLGSARAVMMTIAPAKQDFAMTLLLDFEVGKAANRAASGRPRAPGAGSPLPVGPLGIGGWMDATTHVAAKSLLRELPRGGLGGLVLSVDLAAVAAHSPRSAHMVWDLRDAYTGFGLDFGRNVLDRLASRGTVQLHFDAPLAAASDAQASDARAPDAQSPEAQGSEADGSGSNATGSREGRAGDKHDKSVALAAVHPVYSIRAKSRTSAEDLFDDLRRVVESTSFGKVVVVKDAKGKRLLDVLHLTGPQFEGRRGRLSAFVCLHDDSVLLAESQQALVQAQQELHRNKPRGRRDQLAASAIKTIGGDRVAGLFDLDFEPLFLRIQAALSGADLSSLPKRHVGYIDTDSQDGAAVVRIRVLSSK